MPNAIGWCDGTLNPITGCTPTSAGCDHCYARRLSGRRFGEWKNRDFSILQFHPERLQTRLKKKSERIFIGSMSDIGHPLVKREWLEATLDFVRNNPQHQFIFLTKRPKNLDRRDWEDIPNIILGVSVEDQSALGRIMSIYNWKVKKVISFEPLLENISVPSLILRSINWAIVGVETGPGRRLCQSQWIQDITESCVKWEVPVYVKTFPKGYPINQDSQNYLQQFREFPR